MRTTHFSELLTAVLTLSLILSFLGGCGSGTSTAVANSATLEESETEPNDSANAEDTSDEHEDTQASDNNDENREVEDNTLIHDLLSDWFDYLYVCECGYGHDIWASEAVSAFTSNPDWNRLLIARMAVSAAAVDLEERKLDPAILGKNDYAELKEQRNMDLQNILYEHESWELDRSTLYNQLETLKNDLSLNFFWKYNLESLDTKAALNRAFSEKALEYLAAETEYILITLGEQEEIPRFQLMVSEHCPRIAAYLPDEPGADGETVLAKGNEVFKAMEDYLTELNELIGFEAVDLDTFSERIENEDWSKLKEESTVISNLPTILPYPDWEDEDFEEMYYWKEEDGTLSVPMAGDEITRAPDGGRIIFQSVEASELLKYRDFLTELGVEYLSSKEENGVYTVLYTFPDGTMSLTWKNGNVEVLFMDGVVCFAPYWYIIAKMYAG